MRRRRISDSACASFFALSRLPVDASNFPAIAALHALAGLSVGCALSITHGAIGRTANPHRLFGLVNVALGVVGVITFATVPALIANVGAQTMFVAFAGIMGVACLVSAAAFPETSSARPQGAARRLPVPAAAWLVIFVVIFMTFNQAMVFSFLEQLGLAHGFAQSSINGVLIALGFVNLLPGALAALLQRRLPALGVGFAGPVAQAILALTLSFSTSFIPFAAAGAVFVSVVIFTHTFLFGLLSRLDTSGRAVAATPAMMMIGSSTGPAVGGLIVSTWGYQGLGVAAASASSVALVLLTVLRLQLRAPPPPWRRRWADPLETIFRSKTVTEHVPPPTGHQFPDDVVFNGYAAPVRIEGEVLNLEVFGAVPARTRRDLHPQQRRSHLSAFARQGYLPQRRWHDP